MTDRWWKVDDEDVTQVENAFSISRDYGGHWHLLLYEWDSSNNTPDFASPPQNAFPENNKRKAVDSRDNLSQGALVPTILYNTAQRALSVKVAPVALFLYHRLIDLTAYCHSQIIKQQRKPPTKTQSYALVTREPFS
jgi:hypothetical protein